MLPEILNPHRTRLLVRLAFNGLAQAAVALLSAWLMSKILGTSSGSAGFLPVAVLIGAALWLVALRYHELGDAEKLGQSYVLDVRLALLRVSVSGEEGASRQRHGIAMTRLTSDLTSIKNWISLGLARVLVSALSIAGGIAALYVLTPSLAMWGIVIAGAILVLGLCLALPLYLNIRTARRYRGRLAARVGELLMTRETLVQFDAIEPECDRARRMSQRMAGALSQRMAIVGAMQGLTELMVPFTILPATLLVGLKVGASTTQLISVLVVMGFLVAPLRDLLRAIDYALSYRVARRQILRALGGRPARVSWWKTIKQCFRSKPVAEPARAEPRARIALSITTGPEVHEPSAASAQESPDDRRIMVRRGEVCQLTLDGPIDTVMVRWLAGLDDLAAAPVRLEIDGRQIEPDGPTRRKLFKLVSPEQPLLRRSAMRNVTDMAEGADKEWIEHVLRLCQLPEDLELKRLGSRKLGERGRGLSASLEARLRLARAVITEPVVLLIDDPVLCEDLKGRVALQQCATLPIAILIVTRMAASALQPVRSSSLMSHS